jgi:hypothetical protein
MRPTRSKQNSKIERNNAHMIAIGTKVVVTTNCLRRYYGVSKGTVAVVIALDPNYTTIRLQNGKTISLSPSEVIETK